MMKLTPEMQIDIMKWCNQAVELNLDKKDVSEKFKTYPWGFKRKVLKIFKKIKKDKDERRLRYKKMPKFENVEEDEDADEEFTDEELEEQERNPPKPAPRSRGRPVTTRPSPSMYEETVSPVDTNRQRPWVVKHEPERFLLFDPNANTNILEAGSLEELNIKIQVMQAQHSVEAARNTR